MRVSGASAGAIAAAIYALDGDIENILASAASFDSMIAQKFPTKRMKRINVVRRLILNQPIYDEASVHALILELLNKAGISGDRTIAALMNGKTAQLRISCSDILGLTKPVHNETSQTQLVEALVDSCAIPIAFRMPVKGSSKSCIVDGGLFQNLPSEEALKDLRPGQRAMGVSFVSEVPLNRAEKGVLNYAMAIFEGMVSERVEESKRQLGPSNVLQLHTDISTFDFASVFEGKVRQRFYVKSKNSKKQFEAWFQGSLARSSPDWFSLEKHDLLELEHLTSSVALSFYEQLRNTNYHADVATQEVYAQSLMGDDYPDIYTTTLGLSGDKNQGLQFLKLRFYVPDDQQLLHPSVHVVGKDDKPFPALIIPLREAGGIRARSVLICFSRPLATGDSVRVRKTETAFGAMKKYKEKGWTEETLALTAGKSADFMSVIIHFPALQVPKTWNDADESVAIEANEISEQDGKQVLTISQKSPDTARGCVTYTNSTTEVSEPSDKTRYIKIFYYK
ncbi:hypothetical protein NYA22BAC_01270 [Parasphingorhabdus sp. NYA22]